MKVVKMDRGSRGAAYMEKSGCKEDLSNKCVLIILGFGGKLSIPPLCCTSDGFLLLRKQLVCSLGSDCFCEFGISFTLIPSV